MISKINIYLLCSLFTFISFNIEEYDGHSESYSICNHDCTNLNHHSNDREIEKYCVKDILFYPRSIEELLLDQKRIHFITHHRFFINKSIPFSLQSRPPPKYFSSNIDVA